MEFYETLNAADLLITDYSSVYFDYLLLDRPLIFVPVDLEEYIETRGYFWNLMMRGLLDQSAWIKLI